MKSLRKSLNAHKDSSSHISTPLPSLSKPTSAILPPKRVIKALHSYKANAPQELSFEKGDFFHVLSDGRSNGDWYEAHNPITGARGLVPCHMFEEFQKGTSTPRMSPAISHRPLSAASKLPAYYAVVLHDFVAERMDELEAKAGDYITVVAQSNKEWFVAKPISRLGRPGLIPVTFVEVHDPVTNQPIADIMGLIESGALPRVEEWKRAVMSYKANSIALGVLEDSLAANIARSPSTATKADVPPVVEDAALTSSPQPQYADSTTGYVSHPPSPKQLQDGILLSADVTSFHFETDEYWFRVHALYQPYNPSPSSSLPPAKSLVLFRSYNDFYDFQIALLDAFPTEAGRSDSKARILPYMPGPTEKVSNELMQARCGELDEYIHKLCELQQYARYILENRLVRDFVALRPGDAEVEVQPCTTEVEALSQSSYANHDAYAHDEVSPGHATERLSQPQVLEGVNGHASDGSDYGEGAAVLVDEQDSYSHASNTQRASHSTPEPSYNTTQPLRPRSRNNGHSRVQSSTSIYSRSPQASSSTLQSEQYASSHSRSSIASSQNMSRVSQTGSVSTSRTSASGRSRSQSNATYNPPISATNPQVAFNKIKIYDPLAEEIYAIRAHPKATFGQLLEKASQRVGRPIKTLQSRSPETSEFVNMQDDDDLKTWLEDENRHNMLYAVG
ncbi:uncharacterized protein FIBRA_01183 [Fibroporia radiculosa]|uniref:Protein scd2/ral3 n=1 Tax=Fibroporia radiculosa TaxID=599839 RepID=J4G0U6_9APHY|nr:uncharacterized protein FIBRA_01183 [Fibroporia radiculosa]CCL99168.1 predicted protein [Fibroporia radiculosa]